MYETQVQFVNNPSPIYNCHGLVFGCRRSQISDSQEIKKALQEDDYLPVDSPQIGDVVVYEDANGHIDHSGLIIGIDTLGESKIPKVLSKWGSGYEVVHSVYVCPYSGQPKYYRISK